METNQEKPRESGAGRSGSQFPSLTAQSVKDQPEPTGPAAVYPYKTTAPIDCEPPLVATPTQREAAAIVGWCMFGAALLYMAKTLF
jgi:hypothetical protein